MDPHAQDSFTNSGDILIINKKMINGVSNPARLQIYKKNMEGKKNVKDSPKILLWLQRFKSQCRLIIGSSSMTELLNLMDVYIKFVSKDVTSSYTKPNSAGKVGKIMLFDLTYFHYHYLSIKTALDDAAYMDKMSTLLTMYIDMEIKASRRGKEGVHRIASKLVSSLFLFLNNSLEYIFDTVLKIKFAVKSFREVCILIFRGVVKAVATPDDLTYVRCLMLFKVWKRILPVGEERNSVNRLAVATLKTPPPSLLLLVRRGFFKKVLPALPAEKTPELVTRFFMTAKFNTRDAIKVLLKLSADSRLNDFEIDMETSRLLYGEQPSEKENVTNPESKKAYGIVAPVDGG